MEDGSWERKDTLKFEDDGELAFLEHLSPILGLCLHFLSFAVTWRWARMHTSSALYSFSVHLSSCIPPPSLVKNFFREMCSIVVVRLNASLYTPFVWKSLPPSLLNPDFSICTRWPHTRNSFATEVWWKFPRMLSTMHRSWILLSNALPLPLSVSLGKGLSA